MPGKMFPDKCRRVTIRKEEPDGFTAPKLKCFRFNLKTHGAGKMKARSDPLQTTNAGFNFEIKFAIASLDTKIEQKCHQPVPRR